MVVVEFNFPLFPLPLLLVSVCFSMLTPLSYIRHFSCPAFTRHSLMAATTVYQWTRVALLLDRLVCRLLLSFMLARLQKTEDVADQNCEDVLVRLRDARGVLFP